MKVGPGMTVDYIRRQGLFIEWILQKSPIVPLISYSYTMSLYILDATHYNGCMVEYQLDIPQFIISFSVFDTQFVKK